MSSVGSSLNKILEDFNIPQVVFSVTVVLTNTIYRAEEVEAVSSFSLSIHGT